MEENFRNTWPDLKWIFIPSVAKLDPDQKESASNPGSKESSSCSESESGSEVRSSDLTSDSDLVEYIESTDSDNIEPLDYSSDSTEGALERPALSSSSSECSCESDNLQDIPLYLPNKDKVLFVDESSCAASGIDSVVPQKLRERKSEKFKKEERKLVDIDTTPETLKVVCKKSSDLEQTKDKGR